MFKIEYYTREYMTFVDTTILPSGQIAYIQVYRDTGRKTDHYSIFFTIANKRKDIENTDFQITGKDGLLGLLWARDKVAEFETYIQECISFDKTKKHILYCTWTDNRRRKAYEWGLKKLGFSYMYVFGHKALGKIIYEP